MRKTFWFLVVALASLAPCASAQNLSVPGFLVVHLPEPSSPALLASDLLFVGVLVFLFRRKSSGTNR